MSKQFFSIEGGIGDIIRAIPGYKKIVELFGEETECILLSHFKEAESFLKYFGVKIKEFHYYSNNTEYVAILSDPNYKKLLNDENYIGNAFVFVDNFDPFYNIWNGLTDEDARIPEHWDAIDLITKQIIKQKNLSEENEVKIYGIHPFGSNFSNVFLKSVNMPEKDIPKEQVSKIIKDIYGINHASMFIIFGSKKEEDDMMNYLYKTCDGICIIPSFKNTLIMSLALVDMCNFIIAADSAIKTFSCMHEIPTVVFLGDYIDKPRDEKFINPFEKTGILKTIRYKDKITKEHSNKLLDIMLYERNDESWKNIR